MRSICTNYFIKPKKHEVAADYRLMEGESSWINWQASLLPTAVHTSINLELYWFYFEIILAG